MHNQDFSSRDLNLLNEEFRPKAIELLESCKRRGVEMRPFFTIRGPAVQARLWRQSRSRIEIQNAINNLKDKAPCLMKVLEQVGPQFGRWTTNSLPGQSWHQFGEAMDCFAVNSMGQAVWNSQYQVYAVYAEEAKRLGLNAGHYWKSRDSVHVQLRREGVRDLYTWIKIEEEMKARYAIVA